MKKLLIIIYWLPICYLNAQPDYTLHSDILYDENKNVDPEFRSLDLYIPQSSLTSMPVIIYVHGGGWSLGDKQYVGDKPSFFTNNDIIFISVNYRLSTKTLGPPASREKQFPMHAYDVAKAIKWVYGHIENYNGDPDQLILMGHSAGAHLANIIATNTSFIESTGLELKNIAGVCSLDGGVFNVSTAIANARGKARKNMLLNAFGYDSLVHRQASPFKHISITKRYPPFLLVYQNTRIRAYWNEKFGNKLRKVGTKVSYFNANHYNHAQIDQMIGNKKDTMALSRAILSFVEKCTAE